MSKNHEDENTPVTVFTGYAWEASIIKHLLEKEGVESFTRDDNMYLFAPAAGGTVSIVVARKNLKRVMPVVFQYEKITRR
jgi:hypothetical protein